ncbi:MAG: NAD-dependent epimerase/dehydratase family protein [Alphaproteobacteria bacterium]|nr:NAD-dependent epimerase/dehydratase family protein [Alphaproteobacteria bacterium]
MTQTTFLTGATGFLGTAVARLLLRKGHRVRALVRPNSDRKNLEGLDLDLVEGNLTDPSSYRESLRGCYNMFHVAADYRLWVRDADAMRRVNVDGTRMLMLEALDAGVRRIVYTSSVATLGLNKDGTPSNERTPVSFSDMVGTYKQTKYLAEQEVLRLIRHHKLPAVIVNPSTPIGPRDIKPTPTGKIIVDAVRGKMPAYVDTGLNVVHVDDVAMGHWLALERGRVGAKYILGGTNLPLETILTIIADIVGRPPPKIKLPQAPLFPIALGMEALAHLTGIEPMMTVDTLRMAKKKMYFSTSLAEHELGYTFRPAREAIADAIAWFRAEWYC